MVGGNPTGGSLELARLIDEHGDSLVGDFRLYFGRDITDVFVDGTDLTPRKALAYIRALPFGCSTSASLQGGQEHRGWTPDTYMAANIVDAVQNNTYAFVSANQKKNSKTPAPTPVERPQNREKRKRSEPKANKFSAMARMAYKAGRKDRKDA